MGFFTTSKQHPTLKAKAKNKINEVHQSKLKGAVCVHCSKPIMGKATSMDAYHPKCALKTRNLWDN